MARRELSREELSALVWERPASEVAKELGVSDVAVAKLCARLQVPKPPRGYWARIRSGQTPPRAPLHAFWEEVDRKRRAAVRARAAELLSDLQQQFYTAAIAEMKGHGIDVSGADIRGGRLPDLSPDIAAQVLLLIQSRGNDWVEEGKVDARLSHPVHPSAAKLVDRLLPLARPQLLIFETEARADRYTASGPVVLVRLTARLQERIAALARLVREQQLQHVVMPLMAADHAWSARYLYTPASRLYLDGMLCVSASELWVECLRPAWREGDPPERITTGRVRLQAVMPVDYLPVRDVPLTPVVSRVAVAPYRERLRALCEAERVHELMTHAAYALEREVPDEQLAVADRIWFGKERSFWSAREAWRRAEEELDRWEVELEAERRALATSILGIDVGDIVTSERRGRLQRLAVSGVSLYASDKQVTFIVYGTRFRKDGTLGKLQETISLNFENDAVE